MNNNLNGSPLTQPARITVTIALLLFLTTFQSLGQMVIAASPLQQATITVDAGKTIGHISPLLYGQFIEFMFEGVKRGLHAELLRDRSFAAAPNAIGLPRYWERYPDDRNDDYGLNFTWDDSVFYSGKQDAAAQSVEHALRVDVGDGVVMRHGVFQSRIPVRQRIEYQGYLWLKSTGYRGSVSVALEQDVLGGAIYAESSLEHVSGDWRKYEFRLRPRQADPLARFAILFNGQGRIWVDQVSLLPADAVDGVRRDVFEKARVLKPAFIRWPGGNVAQDYHWLWGVGPRDERTTWTNLSWKNEPESSDFGTDELIRFSRNVGAEPSLTVNVEGRGATVEEAAAWVEYCNGPASSKYGALRAAHGHRQPYGVKLWELGNEIWGDWVRGHSDADTYARNFNRYALVMRAVDPTIKLIAVGDNDMNWNRTVLHVAGTNIDYLAIHHYYGRKEMAGDPLNLMARPLFYEHFYQQVARLLSEVLPRHQVKLAINEWGLDLPAERQYSIEAALYGARLMNVFERSGDLVAMSAVSDMVNGWPGGIIQAGSHSVFVSPLYLVNQIYREHLGAERLASEIVSPIFDSSKEGRRIPYLDAVASRTSDGKQIFLKAVNMDRTRALATRIDMRGARVLPRAELATIGAPSFNATNSFSTPESVTVTRKRVPAAASFLLTLPPHSVSVLTLHVALPNLVHGKPNSVSQTAALPHPLR